MKTRDSQRQKVYDSELGLPGKRELGSFEETVAWVEKVWSARWTRDRFPLALRSCPRVRDGRGTTIARSFGTHWINLPRWARTNVTTLHEICHSLTPERPAHGREFAANFVRLVQHFIGVECAKALKANYRKFRVRWKPKRKLSPETAERLRQRGLALAARRRGRVGGLDRGTYEA